MVNIYFLKSSMINYVYIHMTPVNYYSSRVSVAYIEAATTYTNNIMKYFESRDLEHLVSLIS